MCRDKAHGGRRCPSSMNPEKRQQANAQRRAKYALQKANASVLNANSVTIPRWCQSDVTLSPASSSHSNSLGLSIQRLEGALVESKYFAQTQVFGRIDYTKLDDSSYQQFGFTQPSSAYIEQLADDENQLQVRWDRTFAQEIEHADLSESSQICVNVYTAEAAREVNAALRGKTVMANREEEKEAYCNSRRDLKQRFDRASLSPQLLKEFTRHLDEGLQKGPGLQRKVYRGISKSGLRESNLSKPEFLASFSLGQEVVFDDYQSTSLSGPVAADFAESDGVMFEILTPDGLGIEELSVEGGEMEMLLPRGSRYMTVGRHQVTSSEKTLDVVQLVAIDDSGNVRHSALGQYQAPPLTDNQLKVVDS